MQSKFKFMVKGKYEKNIGAIKDITMNGKGSADALINAMVLGLVSFATEYDVSEKEVINAIKETFQEEKENRKNKKGDK